jgi:hypothetical protein
MWRQNQLVRPYSSIMSAKMSWNTSANVLPYVGHLIAAVHRVIEYLQFEVPNCQGDKFTVAQGGAFDQHLVSNAKNYGPDVYLTSSLNQRHGYGEMYSSWGPLCSSSPLWGLSAVQSPPYRTRCCWQASGGKTDSSSRHRHSTLPLKSITASQSRRTSTSRMNPSDI